MTTVADRAAYSPSAIQRLEAQVSKLEVRVDELSNGVRECQAALRNVQIAVFALAIVTVIGMSAMWTALTFLVLKIG